LQLKNNNKNVAYEYIRSTPVDVPKGKVISELHLNNRKGVF
jgi:hypothetical protein